MLFYQTNIISVLKFRELRVPPKLTFRNKKLRSYHINRKRYFGTENGSQRRKCESVRMAGFVTLLEPKQASPIE
jgi:hypothetical protein